jgi:tripeptidyl-peptidase-1
VINDLATAVQTEQAVQDSFYSGGGFSKYFTLPSYQKSAVSNYYAKYGTQYTAHFYSNSTQARGFPDVSANGWKYLTIMMVEQNSPMVILHLHQPLRQSLPS